MQKLVQSIVTNTRIPEEFKQSYFKKGDKKDLTINKFIENTRITTTKINGKSTLQDIIKHIKEKYMENNKLLCMINLMKVLDRIRIKDATDLSGRTDAVNGVQNRHKTNILCQ